MNEGTTVTLLTGTMVTTLRSDGSRDRIDLGGLRGVICRRNHGRMDAKAKYWVEPRRRRPPMDPAGCYMVDLGMDHRVLCYEHELRAD